MTTSAPQRQSTILRAITDAFPVVKRPSPANGTAAVVDAGAPFHTRFADVPANALVTGTTEIPVALLAQLRDPSTPYERCLALLEALGEEAGKPSLAGEMVLPWFLTLRMALDVAAQRGVPTDVLQPLRWRVVQLAVRVGMVRELEDALDIALAGGLYPEGNLHDVERWNIMANRVPVITILEQRLLSRYSPELPAVQKITRSFNEKRKEDSRG